MYNSYLEYVLDNPVNYDFTKTAGFLDKLIGKGAKAVAEEAKVIPGREFISNPKNADKIRALKEKVQHNNWEKSLQNPTNWQKDHLDVLDKASRKRFFPNGIKDVHPTSVTRNADGARVLKYENPYWKQLEELNLPYKDPRGTGLTGKARAYDKLLEEKRRAMSFSDMTKNNKVRDITFGPLSANPKQDLLAEKGFGVRVGKPMSRLEGAAYHPTTNWTADHAYEAMASQMRPQSHWY